VDSKRWLLVGLGNPGTQYENTRHNAGFLVIQNFAQRWGISAKAQGKLQAILGTATISLPAGPKSLVVAQPTTFMNLSGEAVGKILHYYQIEPSEMLVIYDDAALPLGKIRIRAEGTDGGQKGMKSIIQALGGNTAFPRLRVGIGAPPGKHLMTHHVLTRFGPEEEPLVEKVLDLSVESIETVLTDGVEAAMTRFNGLDLAEGAFGPFLNG
jgi:peptidyl-tRNA hydrolase, PTH1 family